MALGTLVGSGASGKSVLHKKEKGSLCTYPALSKRVSAFQGNVWLKHFMERLPCPSWLYITHRASQTLKMSDGPEKGKNWKRNDASRKPVDQAKSFQMLRTKDKAHFPAMENWMSCNNCNCHFRALWVVNGFITDNVDSTTDLCESRNTCVNLTSCASCFWHQEETTNTIKQLARMDFLN